MIYCFGAAVCGVFPLRNVGASKQMGLGAREPKGVSSLKHLLCNGLSRLIAINCIEPQVRPMSCHGRLSLFVKLYHLFLDSSS